MYFFRDNRLAQDLKSGIVTEKEKMLYLMIGMIIVSVLTTHSFAYISYCPVAYNDMSKILDAITLIAVAGSIFYSFWINDKGDGRNFVSRYTCISLPIAIKVLILGFIVGAITAPFDNPELLSSLDDVEFDESDLKLGFYGLGSLLLIYAYSFWRLHVCFKIASGQTGEP